MSTLVLVDTNVWVSALINPYGYPAKLKDAWLDGKFQVVVSLPLLKEIANVLQRPRIKDKYHLTETQIKKFLTLLSHKALHVTVRGNLKLCRDPYDDLILETAIVSNVKYMVSRDDDIKGDIELITQMKNRGIIVSTVNHFLQQLSTVK